MAAYLIGHITVKDPSLWAIYVEGVAASLEPYRGEVVFRGRRASLLAGGLESQSAVVLRFPDHPTLLEWFHSPGYQRLIATRDAAAEVVLAGYEEMG